MAHHNSTPRRVLDAPTLTVVTVAAQGGFNRARRRHERTESGALVFNRLWWDAPVYNTPFERRHMRARRFRRAAWQPPAPIRTTRTSTRRVGSVRRAETRPAD